MNRDERMQSARVYAIIGVVVAGLALMEAAHSYSARGAQCGGGLGFIGHGFLIFLLGIGALLLMLGLTVFTVGSAVIGRWWTWVAGLVATLGVGVVTVVGSDSAMARQAVGTVFGAGCGADASTVTVAGALVFVSMVELAYVLAHGSTDRG